MQLHFGASIYIVDKEILEKIPVEENLGSVPNRLWVYSGLVWLFFSYEVRDGNEISQCLDTKHSPSKAWAAAAAEVGGTF